MNNSARSLVLVACAIVTLGARAQGGDLIGNGGGLAESNLVYAFKSLPEFLTRASGHALFQSDPWASALAELVPVARRESTQIANLVIADNPRFFEGRRYVLSSDPLTRIAVNVQALYGVSPEGASVPMDLPKAFAFATELLSHRISGRDDALWTEFGARAERVARVRAEILPVAEHGSCNASFTALADPRSFEAAALLMTDEEKVFDFLPRVSQGLRCASGAVAQALSLSQFRWATNAWPAAIFRVSLKCGGAWSPAFEARLAFHAMTCELNRRGVVDLSKITVIDGRR